jgi:hypothetical protein
MADARCGWCPTRRMGSRCLMTGHRCAVRSEPVVALARTVRVYSRSAVAEFARAAGADERSIRYQLEAAGVLPEERLAIVQWRELEDERR